MMEGGEKQAIRNARSIWEYLMNLSRHEKDVLKRSLYSPAHSMVKLLLPFELNCCLRLQCEPCH